MNVIVVGGGIIGAAIAYQLASVGIAVTVIDRDDPPSGATSRGDGGLLLVNKRANAVALAREAIAAWDRVLPLLGEVELETNECLLVAFDDRTADQLRERARVLRDGGVETREMSGAQCRRHEPGLSPDVRFGILARGGYRIQQMLAGAALLRLACAAGARVLRHTEVIDVTNGSVTTTHGTMHADEVIIAAGAWSAPLLRRRGHCVPIEPRRGHLLVTARGFADVVRHGALDAAYVTAANSASPELYVAGQIVPTMSGSVLLGASRERVGFDQQFSVDVMRRLCAGAVRLYPGLERARIVRGWVGFRPWTPDGFPMVGRLEEGLLIAAGHEGEGITYAALTGETVCAVLTGGADVPASWDPARFEDHDPTESEHDRQREQREQREQRGTDERKSLHRKRSR